MSIKLSTGLRQALLKKAVTKSAVVKMTATTIAAVDGSTGNDSLTDSDDGFLTAGFSVGDSILVIGFAGGAAGMIGPFEILAAGDGILEVATGSLADDAATESVTIVRLCSGSWRDIFKDGVLDLYSGVIPATADTAESGVKLASITLASGAFTGGAAANGLEFGAPSAGVIAKDTGVWSGVGLATGEAGYFVFYDNAYTTGGSTTSVRFMGTCSETSGDLIMSDCTVTEGATKTISAFTITLPAY